jgi:hypothetical protein
MELLPDAPVARAEKSLLVVESQDSRIATKFLPVVGSLAFRAEPRRRDDTVLEAPILEIAQLLGPDRRPPRK